MGPARRVVGQQWVRSVVRSVVRAERGPEGVEPRPLVPTVPGDPLVVRGDPLVVPAEPGVDRQPAVRVVRAVLAAEAVHPHLGGPEVLPAVLVALVEPVLLPAAPVVPAGQAAEAVHPHLGGPEVLPAVPVALVEPVLLPVLPAVLVARGAEVLHPHPGGPEVLPGGPVVHLGGPAVLPAGAVSRLGHPVCRALLAVLPSPSRRHRGTSHW